MRLLLDTHIAVWAVASPQRLSVNARTLLQAKENAVYYSIVTLWEIAIKNSLSKRNNLPFSLKKRQKNSNRLDFNSCNSNLNMWRSLKNCPFFIAIRLTGCWSRKRSGSRSGL